MSRVSGSYESVVRGVSEQNPQSRRSGQHFAQVNLISDPVRGLARRHGSQLQDEQVFPLAGTVFPDMLADTDCCHTFPFFIGGVEHDLIVRTAPREGGRDTFAFCFNKETRAFIPVIYNEGDDLLELLIAGGVSAVANVGRYLFLAGNTIVPDQIINNKWADPDNQKLLAGWIRGGAYKRTFKVKLTRLDNVIVEAEYQTKASSYPGTLDTSDILTADPDYQKKVNDRTNEYNSAVTAYIGEAAQDITPENIAQKLVDNLVIAGVDPGAVQRIDGYVVVSEGYKEIQLEDSGDNSLVRSVGNVIDNLDLVSARHYIGKVLKVEPEDSTGDPVYLEAFAKDEVSTGWTEVVWREAAGVEQTPLGVFCFATVEANRLYIAGNATGLGALAGIADVPDYKPNLVGDDVSAELPEFFGKRVDYLGVFQDRLVIGSGATLFFSRPGDYLNWFRQSVLSVQDDDPWEGFALGAEDDIIKHSVLYDRSLLLYGKRFQYLVSGRTGLTPANASVTIVSSYEDAIDAAPRGSGNFVFYTKHSGAPGKETTSLHQVQPSYVADVSDTYTASQQLDTYLAGKPVEIVAMTAPNMVLLRTDRNRQRLYVYSYLDNPGNNERLFDSWSFWEWDERVGHIIGISRSEADILVYMVKRGANYLNGDRVWVSCERFVRDTDLSDYPYMDSLRPVAGFYEPDDATYINPQTPPEGVAMAIQRGPAEQFLGDSLSNLSRFEQDYSGLRDQTYTGFHYDAYVTPTNPYARDRNEQAILGGRLTLQKTKIAVTDTGGLKCTVEARGSTRESLNFIGRLLGQPIDMVGRQPIVTTDLTAFIGGEVRECKYTLSAIRWLPMTVNSIEWQGQFFFNTRRA